MPPCPGELCRPRLQEKHCQGCVRSCARLCGFTHCQTAATSGLECGSQWHQLSARQEVNPASDRNWAGICVGTVQLPKLELNIKPTPLLVWNFLFSFEHHETESSNLDFIPRMDFTYYWVYVLFWSCKVLLEYTHRIFKPQLLWLVWNWRKVPSSLDFLRHFLHHSRFPFQVVPCSDPASVVSSDWGLEQSPFHSPGWEGQCEGQVWYRILVPNVISERFTPLSLPCPQLILKYKNCCQLSGYDARENDAKNVTNVGQQELYQVCFDELWRD